MVERRYFLSLATKSSVVAFPCFAIAENFLSTKSKKINKGKLVSSKDELTFPRDFGAHLLYGIEWWYVTGWLNDRVDEELAFQLTFFRRKTFIGENNISRFSPKHLIFAHATIISKRLGVLKSAQRAGRLGSGLVMCSSLDTDIQFEDWFMKRDLTSDSYKIGVQGNDFSFRLRLQPQAKLKNLILRGKNGLSRKGPDDKQASWYYSRPNIVTNGKVVVNKKTLHMQGLSWLDHEWSSEFLHPEAIGWDWIGVNLADGGSLMAFKIRRADESIIWSDFSMLDAKGDNHPLINKNKLENIAQTVRWMTLGEWSSPVSFAKYPIFQKILFGDNVLKITPFINNQEIDARRTTGGFYWEGAVELDINGKFFGKGFLELTGYSSPLLLG